MMDSYAQEGSIASPRARPRSLLLQDGRVIACFASDDATSTSSKTAILLEASGARCSIFESDGSICRHVTAFPLRSFQSTLSETLHFRNRHHTYGDGRPPYLCHKLVKSIDGSIPLVSDASSLRLWGLV